MVREVPRIVPPRWRIPEVLSWVSSKKSPARTPAQPLRKPAISNPCALMPRRTTARITALSPGQSPPPVRMPMRATYPNLFHARVPAQAIARGLPGLVAAAARAAYGCRHGRLERASAVARVQRLVLRAAGRAGPQLVGARTGAGGLSVGAQVGSARVVAGRHGA